MPEEFFRMGLIGPEGNFGIAKGNRTVMQIDKSDGTVQFKSNVVVE